jgi:hypothetical protein
MPSQPSDARVSRDEQRFTAGTISRLSWAVTDRWSDLRAFDAALR